MFGIIAVTIGYSILYYYNTPGRRLGRLINKIHSQHAKAIEQMVSTTQNIVSQMQAVKELEQAITADALRREARAKAALRAVLLERGASPEQIEVVMRDIDGTEAGDL